MSLLFGLVFKEPKTTRSRRTITLPSQTVRELLSHRSRQAKERLLIGSAYKDQGLVFANADGSPEGPDSITARFREFRDDHGFSLRFHDLRHDFASRLVMGGVDLYRVKELLAHGSIAMTERYAHLAPEALAEAVEVLA